MFKESCALTSVRSREELIAFLLSYSFFTFPSTRFSFKNGGECLRRRALTSVRSRKELIAF